MIFPRKIRLFSLPFLVLFKLYKSFFFFSCSCQLSLLISLFWFLPWRVICHLSSLCDIFYLIIIPFFFSTFQRESFKFNFIALLWYFVTSILLSLVYVPLLLFFLPCSPFLSLRTPFPSHPVGLLSHPVLPTLHGLLVPFYVCFVSLREDICQIFISICELNNMQWPLSLWLFSVTLLCGIS